MRLAVIGAGNMGGAMATAAVGAGLVQPEHLLLIEADAQRRENMATQLGCSTSHLLQEIPTSCEIVLLAVKPQQALAVLQDLKEILQPDQILLSILAGTSLQTLQAQSAHDRVVRVMPNTPAQLSAGMSVYLASTAVSSVDKDQVRLLLNTCGQSLEVFEEVQIDAATAISGSGPAYLFYLAEQMLTEACELGFSQEEATQLVQQTLLGATLLWQQSQFPPDELRRRVTSPGGTTDAALRVFEQVGVGMGLRNGVQSAFARARELSQP